MIYLALIASVIVGVFIAYVIKPKNETVQILLAFSGAYLLAIIALHLLPEVFISSSNKNIGAFIILGLLLQLILDFFSKGADHGHIHVHKKGFPWTLFLSLCLHAFMEGFPLEQTHNSLLWAIVIHKIPIAIVLTTFFLQSHFKKRSVLLYLTIFAAMSPLGAYTSESFLFLQAYKQIITAIIIGVFLHIATIILFESSKNHQFNIAKFIAILLGFGLGFLV